MKKCRECSASNANVSYYCYSCGAKLPDETVEDREEAQGLKTSLKEYNSYQSDFEKWKAERLKNFHEEQDEIIKEELNDAFDWSEQYGTENEQTGFYDSKEKYELRRRKQDELKKPSKAFYKSVPDKKKPIKEANQAMLFAILSIFCVGFFLAPVAIYKGLQALKIIQQNPHLEGKSKAQTAIAIAFLVLSLYLAGFIITMIANSQ
jgi:hypothetical protein